MNTKAIIGISALVLGFASFVGVAKLSAAPVVPTMSDPIMVPEVTIMGELTPATIITLPEQFITASPTPKAKARGVNAPSSKGRNMVHTLAQGGRPEATTVRAWGM